MRNEEKEKRKNERSKQARKERKKWTQKSCFDQIYHSPRSVSIKLQNIIEPRSPVRNDSFDEKLKHLDQRSLLDLNFLTF